jgi:hypothetical protein
MLSYSTAKHAKAPLTAEQAAAAITAANGVFDHSCTLRNRVATVLRSRDAAARAALAEHFALDIELADFSSISCDKAHSIDEFHRSPAVLLQRTGSLAPIATEGN